MAQVKTNIEEVAARVPDWQGKTVKIEPIVGGITNPNFRVDVDKDTFFVKIPGDATEQIDRVNCHAANVIAGETGFGPRSLYFYEDTGVEIFEFLHGYRQVNFGDIYNYGIFEKIAVGIAKFHNIEGKNLPLKQSVFEQAWDSANRAKEGTYLPPWHGKMDFMLKICEEAIQKAGVDLKPCHNDFYTNNMMYNEELDDLKIIDYEYASMNDPYYDLGVYATTNFLTEAMDVELCKLYHGGTFNEVGFAKMKLYKIVGDIRFSYWLLQAAEKSANVDFDFMGWYGPKISRLQHLWNDPRVEYWLDLLSGNPIFRKKI